MESGAVWLPLSAAVLVLFVFSRDGGFLLKLLMIVTAIALLSSVPGTAPGQTLDVRMPPDEFIRPFDGRVVVMALPHKPGSRILSLSHRGDGVCAMWLPRVGDPEITEALYQCLAVIEVANCNGAVDINTPAVRARTPLIERVQYERTCGSSDWRFAFEHIRLGAAGH